MGVDAEFYVRTVEPMTDADMEALQAALREMRGNDWYRVYRSFDDERVVECRDGTRFYAPEYARGPWDELRATGDWLMLRFGETAEVRYGGDCDWSWDSALSWPDARKRGDEHWASSGHRTYHWSLDCQCDHCATLPAIGVTS